MNSDSEDEVRDDMPNSNNQRANGVWKDSSVHPCENHNEVKSDRYDIRKSTVHIPVKSDISNIIQFIDDSDEEVRDDKNDELDKTQINIETLKIGGHPGIVYMFNHVKFAIGERFGSDKDVESLTTTFNHFGLEVKTLHDPDVPMRRKIITEIKNKNFQNYACIIFVILSHGDRNDTIYDTYGSYSIDDDILFEILENETLNDKPKIFFIQACKGEWDVDFMKNKTNSCLRRDSVFQANRRRPTNILKCYSTFEGFVSYRHEKYGSLFIKALCENLQQYGKTEDIIQIMGRVNIAVQVESENKGSLQVPSVTTNLTKRFFLGQTY